MSDEVSTRGPPVKCNTCKFYDTSVLSLSGRGVCRGSAPMAAAAVSTSESTRWAVVNGALDWCKEYIATSATWP